MRRLIQLIKLIFRNNISKTLDYYANDFVVDQYIQKINSGPDLLELVAINDMRKNIQSMKSALVIGSGTGRECKFIFEYFNILVTGLEPQIRMLENSYFCEHIKYVSNIDELYSQKFDVIWVTKYLPSFLTQKERKDFYLSLKKLMNDRSVVYMIPDIMPLDLISSFRFKFASLFLKYFNSRYGYCEGDTFRSNLDDFEYGSSDLIFYHYFDCKESFEKELFDFDFKVQELDQNYFRICL